MCLYLQKRSNGVYYFRRTIPAMLQPIIGREHWTYSLHTKVKDEAKRLRSEHAVATDKLIDEAQRELAARERAEHGRNPQAGPSEWLSDFAREEAEFAARKAAERAARQAERRHHRDDWRERLQMGTDQMPARYAALKDIVREHQERAAAAEARLAALQSISEVPRSDTARGSRSRPGGPLWLDTEVVDGWAAERKPNQKGIDTHRSSARWFYERIGRKPVRDLTEDDFLAFKGKLIAEGQTPANIKQKLSHLRTLMAWAKANRLVELNVAADVTIRDGLAARKKRLPFDLAALNAIFNSPVYAEGARPTSLRGEAAYWLPLLALFTGARLEEIGQLRPQDVNEAPYFDSDGRELTAWIIQIREEGDGSLKLKNAASERRVPVHPELVRLSFLDFVRAAKAAKQERLFPLLRANKYGRLTAKWGEHWSKYRRDVCKVTDARMVFHSFRHTFKDYCRLAGIEETLQRALMGHSSSDVADDYGSGAWDHQLVQAMERYRVPGLKVAGWTPVRGAS
jgi:integrase